MSENEKIDIESIIDELSSNIYDMIEDKVEHAVTCALQDVLPEVLSECFSDFEFVLNDGTIIRPKQRMKLLSPDKSKLLVCYGGLRIDGCSLMVQTAIGRWESIACYPDRDAAIAALMKVKNAIDAGVLSYELE